MQMRRVTLLAITVAVSALVLGSIAHAADNQVGTWKLNVAKSKYSPGPAPKEGTLTRTFLRLGCPGPTLSI